VSSVAFVGLGAMGARMAGRLLGAGHDVVVWNRTAEAATPLVEFGAELAASPADAAGRAEAVLIMVADPAALEGSPKGPKVSSRESGRRRP
jgi:3-hydroxyisobutyrate dehydrogenase-like beta-hydroxyacid dehydrogenase